MTTLFGTVEYFEREFATYTEKNNLIRLSDDQISALYSSLEYELLYNFVCSESIRMECFKNLAKAFSKYINSEMRVPC